MTSPTDITLVPMDLPDAGALLPWLASRVEPVFGATCLIAETAPDMSDSYSKERNQFDTRRLLSALAERTESGLVLGVTSKDLFVPIFTFVIGEAYLGGRAAMVSTFRLAEGPTGARVPLELLRARLLKEAVHELGHCHGLVHCLDFRCVMHASSTAEDVDLKTDELCEPCLVLLRAKRRAQAPARRG